MSQSSSSYNLVKHFLLPFVLGAVLVSGYNYLTSKPQPAFISASNAYDYMTAESQTNDSLDIGGISDVANTPPAPLGCPEFPPSCLYTLPPSIKLEPCTGGDCTGKLKLINRKKPEILFLMARPDRVFVVGKDGKIARDAIISYFGTDKVVNPNSGLKYAYVSLGKLQAGEYKFWFTQMLVNGKYVNYQNDFVMPAP